MTQYDGNSQDVSAPILSADYWKKGTQISGTVIRSFKTSNGVCYTIELKKPIKVNRQHTYPKESKTESLFKVSVGSLKGFEMALQASGIPEGKLQSNDKVEITCTGKTPTNKGNPQVDFTIKIDRVEDRDIPF
jgi:hypothetical protein